MANAPIRMRAEQRENTMKTTLVAASAAAFIVISGAASASQVTNVVNGTVRGIDMSNKCLTLDDGKNYCVADTYALDTFKIGDAVVIAYDPQKREWTLDTLAQGV